MPQINSASYSKLIEEISSNNVSSLVLFPNRREVLVKFKNGTKNKVPLLRNDQFILRAAQASRTPLSVRDTTSEEALAGLVAPAALFLVLIFALSVLIKRSTNFANKTLGFSRTNSKIFSSDDIGVRFDDVAGLEEASEELLEIVTFLKNPEKLIQLGARIPKGVLLSGPPGTGKTLLAKAIAGEAGVPFFSIAASEFVELFVGVGASRVRDLFKKAKQTSPCIVFIDEIDAAGRQRGTGIGGGNDEREQTLNQLLTEMDGFSDNSGVIVLAATNRIDVLDSALLRPGRFDRQITLGFPDRKARLGILSVHARQKPLSQEVDLSQWAACTAGFTGADLDNLLNEAAIFAARKNNNVIKDSHIEEALERLTRGIASPALLQSSRKSLLAYREIAKAIVSTIIPNGEIVDKISIIPTNLSNLGSTRYTPDEDVIDSGLYTKSFLYSKLVILLAGRASEILVFGNNEITQGSEQELYRVTSLAREMVTKFGFSSLGPLSLSNENSQVFIGRGLIQQKNILSNRTGNKIDIEVRNLIFSALERSIDILNKNLNLLDFLAAKLVEEETISGKEFERLSRIQRGNYSNQL